MRSATFVEMLPENGKLVPVALVLLDEQSHEALGQPFNAPWDRTLHARLIERLHLVNEVHRALAGSPRLEARAKGEGRAGFGIAMGTIVLLVIIEFVLRYVRARRLSEAARQLCNGAPDILTVALVARTRSSHHNCRESDCELRVQSGTRIIELLVSFDSEVRFGACGRPGRTSESGH